MKRLFPAALALLWAVQAQAQLPPINGVAGPTTSVQLKSIITDATGSGPLNFGPSAASITVGTTTIASGTTLRLLYDNAGVLGESLTTTTAAGTINIPDAQTLGIGGNAMVANFPTFNAGFLGAYPLPTLTSSATGGHTECAGVYGQYNIGIGKGAGAALTNGCKNFAAGYNALNLAVHDSASLAIGAFTLQKVNGGDANSGAGYEVLSELTNGVFNAGFGNSVFQDLVTGGYNSGFGAHVFLAATSGDENAGFGNGVGASLIAPYRNALFGNNSMPTATIGTDNATLGHQTYFSATSISKGVAVGAFASNRQTTGDSNAAGGYQNMFSNLTGVNNASWGAGGLYNNTVAVDNATLGEGACYGVDGAYTGTGNVCLGKRSGYHVATGTENNVFVGNSSGFSISTGKQNVDIGAATSSAGLGSVTTGDQNIKIGFDNAVASPTASGQLVIGNFIYGTGLTGTGATISSGKIGIGVKAPATALDVAGAITASSDVVLTNGTFNYAVGGGSADAQTITLSPAATAYKAGAMYCWKAVGTNTTTTPTLSVNGLGATTMVKRAATALAAGDVLINGFYCGIYNGTNIQVLWPTVP